MSLRQVDRLYRIFVALAAVCICATTADAAGVGEKIAVAAMAQVGVTTRYDPAYVALSYPKGDVPIETGVCADVVVRALRKIGVDLQAEVHDDMSGHFKEYPNRWGLKKPDSNIDHRRVPNLMKYFERKGKSVSSVRGKRSFEPGDIVAWKLKNGLYHIGVVSTERMPKADRFLMVHNIGQGAQKEDVLNAFQIIGHYRWN